jgi:hypothetical protein
MYFASSVTGEKIWGHDEAFADKVEAALQHIADRVPETNAKEALYLIASATSSVLKAGLKLLACGHDVEAVQVMEFCELLNNGSGNIASKHLKSATPRDPMGEVIARIIQDGLNKGRGL